MYTDIYIAHPDKAALEEFVSNFVNHLPVAAGIPASAKQEAVGDVGLWYTGVRSTFDITESIQEPFVVIPAVLGSKIVGIWA